MSRIVFSAVLCALLATPAWAISGNLLALNSGVDVGGAAVLNDNGYTGTYVTLAAPGSVTVTVNASGVSAGGVDPRMSIVINDKSSIWDVGPATLDYEYTVDLPAGTHFIRTEFTNDRNTGRSLQVN